MNIVPVDIVFAVIVIILTARCVFRGFIVEFMSIQAVLGGLVLAFMFSPLGAAYLNARWRPSAWNRLIAFLVIFLVVYLVFKVLERLLTKFFERLSLENLDRALGFFLGILEGVLVVLLIIFIIEIQPFADPEAILGGSIAARWGRILLPGIFQMFTDDFGLLI